MSSGSPSSVSNTFRHDDSLPAGLGDAFSKLRSSSGTRIAYFTCLFVQNASHALSISSFFSEDASGITRPSKIFSAPRNDEADSSRASTSFINSLELFTFAVLAKVSVKASGRRFSVSWRRAGTFNADGMNRDEDSSMSDEKVRGGAPQ